METSTTTTTAVIGDDQDQVAMLGRGLRAMTSLVELLDEHGVDLPFRPYITSHGHRHTVGASWYVDIHVEGGDAEKKAATAAIVRALGGKWEKQQNDRDLSLTQTRGDVELEIVVARDAVCEWVVVGTREVTLPATSAQPAVEAQPERTVVEEVVEWRCAPILDGVA